jgi:hypothetical protein
LIEAGADVRYEHGSDLEAVLDSLRRKGRIPHGIVFHFALEEAVREYLPALKGFLRSCAPSRPRLLFDWGWGDHTILPDHSEILSRGNVLTSAARTLVHYLVETHHSHALFYFDDSRPLWSYEAIIWPIAKIRTELRAVGEAVPYRFLIHTSSRDMTASELLRRVSDPRKVLFLLNKYDRASLTDLEAEVSVTHDPVALPSGLRDGVLVCSDSGKAAAAHAEATRRKMRVPRDLSILTLDDDPHYYHQGISSCGPDFERVGYLMARAVLGDLPVARTSRGFIRSAGRVIERGTTRTGG